MARRVLLREKDGVAVYRTKKGILKVFRQKEHRREIRFYEILQARGVPTLQVLARKRNALLLEDLERSPAWRLGRAEDMDDPAIARAIAAWYRALHAAGREYPALRELPGETDVLTEENLRALAERFPCEAFWPTLLANYAAFWARLQALPQTLTYNDFYWSNLAVARDGTAALMFDYNLAGRGTAYGDVRNVTFSLSEAAAEAFREAYGPVCPAEQRADAVAGVLVALWTAAQRKQFPQWGEALLAELADGTLLQALEALLEQETNDAA